MAVGLNKSLSLGVVWIICWFLTNSIFLISLQMESANSKEISGRYHRSPQPPQQQQHDQLGGSLAFDFTSDFGESNSRPRGHQLARQLMLHNQEVSSGRGVGNLPLYKQSYPGLYTQSEIKEFAYEPTMPVTHGNGHHGKDAHLFLLQPDTSHIFRGVAHAIHHENLI